MPSKRTVKSGTPRSRLKRPSSRAESSDAVVRRRRLVEICRALPEADVEVAGQTHLAFRVRKKIFAYYLDNHHGDGRIAFCCKAAPGVQQGLVEDDPFQFFVPSYLGAKGWVAIRLDLDRVDWGLVAGLAKRAYLQSAPKKLAALAE